MEQNDRCPLPGSHIALPDVVGADRVMLNLSHGEVLKRLISAVRPSLAAKTHDGCSRQTASRPEHIALIVRIASGLGPPVAQSSSSTVCTNAIPIASESWGHATDITRRGNIRVERAYVRHIVLLQLACDFSGYSETSAVCWDADTLGESSG
jgi:hypothetical protein